ncbi:MAG: TolC family protein [Cyanothece sp. SIO1E1]|nr:TolC family protein [Cyanothece sp. SIO1E1]
MKNIILSLWISTLPLMSLIAQDTGGILEQYIQTGLAQNLALQQEKLEVQKSLAALREAKSLFYPQVSFEATYTRAAGGRTIDIPVGDLLNPVYQTLNDLSAAPQFPSEISNASEPILPDDFHDTRIFVQQPLYNAEIYLNYKLRQALSSAQEIQKSTYEQELRKEIKEAYYQYLQTQEVLAIYDSTESLLQEVVRINQELVNNHKVTKDVVFAAKFELEDLYGKQAEALQQAQMAKSYFNFLLNRSLDEEIERDSSLQASPSLYGTLAVQQEKALATRSELAQIREAIYAQELNVQLQQAKKLPNLSLGAMAGFQGFGYKFNGQQDYALLQLNLSVPIYTAGKNEAKILQSQIQLEHTQSQYQHLQQRIRLQVIDAFTGLQAALSKIEAKEAALASARESFRIIRRKYEENLVLFVELLDARTRFTNAQLEYVIANYDLLIKQAQLERALAL